MKKKAHKPYSLAQVRQSMTTGIKELEGIFMDDQADPDQRIRALNCLSSLCNSYARICETADLEERISNLEQTMQTNGKE